MTLSTHQEIDRLLRSAGVLRRSDHPELARTLDYLVRAGRLRAVLPGIYAAPTAVASFRIRAAATALWSRDAVLVGSTAARLTFWTELADDTIQVAEPSRRLERGGWLAQRRRIDPDLVLDLADPVVARVSAPALTAVDLAAATDGESIDRVLLSRQARLDDLWNTLERCAHRRGIRASKRRLIESRAEPWSKAERLLHKLLHEAGIRRWRANGEVWINDRRYFPDVGFHPLKLAVEVDGKVHLYDPETFQKDRQRQNAFVLAGWTVLRFTWQDITERPEIVIAQIRAALAMLRRRARGWPSQPQLHAQW